MAGAEQQQQADNGISAAFTGFAFIAVCAALLRACWLFATGGELFYDEAQYAYWADYFSFGYYSKPPMVGWLIALTESVCGAGEACARLSSPLLHSGTALFIFGIGARLYACARTAFFAGLIYLTLPGVFLSSTIISVDPALLFFNSGALYFFVRALHDPYKLRFWLCCGAFAGLGMLSKYTMVVFGAGAFFYLLCTPQRRYLLKLKGFWLAALTGAVIFLPNIIWNALNGFPSILHTKDNANLEAASWSPDAFFAFFGGQFGVFGPVFFAALLAGLCCSCRPAAEKQADGAVLVWQIVPMLALISVIALISRAHANWAAPAYIAASVFVARMLTLPRLRPWLWAGLAVNMLAGVTMLFPGPAAELFGLRFAARTNLAQGEVKDPYLRVYGGRELGARLDEFVAESGGAERVTVLTADRATHALLSYYAGIPHERLIKWNPEGRTKDHFDLTTRLDTSAPAPLYLLVTRGAAEGLAPYFADIRHVGDILTGPYEEKRKRYRVYALRDADFSSYIHREARR